MTKPDLDAIRRLAEKATPRWEIARENEVCECPLCEGYGEVDFQDIDGDGWMALVQTYGIGDIVTHNAAYIAAVNPAVMLQVLGYIDRLKASLEETAQALYNAHGEIPDSYYHNVARRPPSS